MYGARYRILGVGVGVGDQRSRANDGGPQKLELKIEQDGSEKPMASSSKESRRSGFASY